jgi:hypothetical protein
VKSDDFLVQVADGTDWWGMAVNEDLMGSLRRGPIDGADDIEVALPLTELVHEEFERYGTDSSHRLADQDVGTAYRALVAVLDRLGIDFGLPFRNLSTFYAYWKKQGASGSWQARRDILNEYFEPLHAQLAQLEERSFEQLATAVSPRDVIGWPAVDDEIRELRRRFKQCRTPQDYGDIGNRCVGLLIALGQTVYNPAKHLRDGETVPAPDKTKQRLGRYVEVTLSGSENEDLRGLTNKAIEFAHHVKHNQTPTRREAGIAADSVILLANIFRRLEQDL